MPRTTRIIHIPRPEKGSFNRHRTLAKNTLLLNQVRHFQMVEKTLPPEKQTGIAPDSVKTEGEASEYIRKMTAILHPQVAKAGGK